MNCFARVVRAILGPSAIAAAKLCFGTTLEVLGLSITATALCIRLRVDDAKKLKWALAIRRALYKGSMRAGEASKFAGRFGFASQNTFHRLGRAMIRPFFAQQYSPLPSGKIGPLLDLALRWWTKVLESDICQEVRVYEPSRVVDLFCDARGTPPRVAAVIIAGDSIRYTDWEPPASLLETFKPRKDEQIMGQELLAIAVGLCTFLPQLEGCCVRVWTDNAGGEGALRKGATKASDHNLIVHAVWLLAARHRSIIVSRARVARA